MGKTRQWLLAALVMGGVGLGGSAWADPTEKDKPVKQAGRKAAHKSVKSSGKLAQKPAQNAMPAVDGMPQGTAAGKPPHPDQPGRQPPTGKKLTLAPLPIDVYLQPNLKPTVAFTTPCILVEKLTNGFPPVLAFEQLMFSVIGNINAADALPVRIEPVCI